MTVSPPSAPILGMYQTGGAFPTPGPSAWASGPTTNLTATYLSFDADWATYGAPFVAQCNANGLVPFVELEPWHYSQAAVPFSDITGGVWDTYLTGIGSAIAATGKPVILTFAHEFNVSGQYPWAQSMTGSGPSGGTLTAAEWIAGWNYVRNKVNSTANGYALWMWACSAYTGGTTISPAAYWPGSSNVDMVGIDGYPNTKYGSSLGTFAGQLQPTVTIIRGLGWTGGIFIAETNLAGMVASGGESITSFVADMAAAGVSGILEFEDAAWGLSPMSSAQWAEYNAAIAENYPSSGGGGGGGGGSGGGGSGGGALTVAKQTADEVHAASGVASSVTAVSPPAGSMVRWCAAWLNSNDTLGLTFTAADSNGVSYGAPTHKGNPGDGDGGCYLLVWDHVYAAAPGPVTLTITASGSGVSGAAPSDCLILPYVITGQAADQSGAAFNHFEEVGTSTTTYEISLATTVPGSVVFVLGAPNHNGGATGPVTAISGTTTDVDWDDAGVGSRGTFGRSTNPTVTPGATTFGWTSANPSPNGYGVMASEIVPDVSGGGTFTPVGSFIETTGTSFTWAPSAVSNILAVIAFSETAGEPVTAMSTPTNASWAQVVSGVHTGSSTVTEATAFIGTAGSTASETVTLTTAAASGNLRVLAHEFAVAGADVALDTFASMDGDLAGAVTAWPAAAPGRNDSELLFGFERNFGSAAAAGSTSGVTYYVDANHNGGAFATGVSAPLTVGWADSDSRTALVLLLYATSGGGSSGGGGGSGGGGSGGAPVAGTAAKFYPGGRLPGEALRGTVPLEAYKSLAESVTNSITPQNDDALMLQLEAGAVYYFEAALGYTGAATGSGDIKLSWSLPEGAVMNYALYGRNAGVATNGYWESQTSVPAVNSAGTATPVELVMQGTVATSTEPGAMQLQWAQHTSSATPTTVLAGSSLLAWRIA